ncbi:MAG TPA: DMT family transporter [Mobilitalea sp.]|nr:DMT family transporter [Mobilitalea sp.]
MKKEKILFITSMLIFGSMGLFVRNINLPSSVIALVRGAIGSLFIFGASKVLKQKISWKAIRPNLLLLLLSGAAIGFNWIFLFQAYKYTTISNATITYYFAPVFVMFLSPFILKEKLSIVKIGCILAAVLGMFMISGIGGVEGRNHLIGIGYALMAATLYASAILINKFMKGMSGLETTIVQIGTASIVLFPYVLLTQRVGTISVDSKSLIFLIMLGIIHTGLGYLIYFTSFRNLSAQTISVFSYIDPISAILMSGIFLGEKMTAFQLCGGVLILGATFFSELYDRRRVDKRQASIAGNE